MAFKTLNPSLFTCKCVPNIYSKTVLLTRTSLFSYSSSYFNAAPLGEFLFILRTFCVGSEFKSFFISTLSNFSSPIIQEGISIKKINF